MITALSRRGFPSLRPAAASFLRPTTSLGSRPLGLVGSQSMFSTNTPRHNPSTVRNVAIIAHVDHGKTTLVDQLIRAGGELANEERVMDSGGLEKERGITIMSKATRVDWEGSILNLVDTPGHADFGGEVERVLSMVDGAILVVDATEGVMSQTKFVVSRALKQGLKFVVVLNKADRDSARLGGEVESEIFDLLCSMDATEEQLEFPVIFASAKQGWAVEDMSEDKDTAGMTKLLEKVVEHIPPPCDESAIGELPFAFSVNNMSFDPYLGRLVTGKIESGEVCVGQKVKVLRRTTEEHLSSGEQPSAALAAQAAKAAATAANTAHAITNIFVIRNGTEREEVSMAQAGDIVVLAGVPMEAVGVSDTVADFAVTEPLPTVPVTPPTICMSFGANDGPLSGKGGGVFLNSSQVKARLEKEVENNVTIILKKSLTDSDQMEVHARGELQLGILIEEMRREKYELCVSPPRILTVIDKETGKELEPVEEVTIDVDQEYAGAVIERMQQLRSPMLEYKEMGDRVRLVFDTPSRLLMGVRASLRNDTSGSAVVNAIFKSYEKLETGGVTDVNEKGRLVATSAGTTTSYALFTIEPRGTLFVGNGEEVYEGMVIGESSKPGDLEVNCAKQKKLTNVRSSGADEKLTLQPPRQMSLEDYITYMGQDEVLEVTPNSIRLRKRHLDASSRHKAQRDKKAASQGKKK